MSIMGGEGCPRADAGDGPTPKAEAAHIAGRIAFWRGIKVIEG